MILDFPVPLSPKIIIEFGLSGDLIHKSSLRTFGSVSV
jgi:hypothetical protein